MRLAPLLAALGASLPVVAIAQSDAPLELGVPGDFVSAQTSAFTIVDANGQNLILFAHPGFMPVVTDYIALAPPEGISVSICGTAFPPFQPSEEMATGMIVIPLGDEGTARRAADVMAGIANCDSFAGHDDGEEVDITDLLPTPSLPEATLSGLTISSPSDTYQAMVEEVLGASVEISQHATRHVIDLTFGPGLATWFAEETEAHIGERIALSVCGSVVTEPVVQEAITDGEIRITGNFQKQEAEDIAAHIRGDIPCGG